MARVDASAGGTGPAPQRRNRSGRTAAIIVVGISALGGLGFGIWAGMNRKAPVRAGDPTSGVPIEGLGVRHAPKAQMAETAPSPPAGAPPPVAPASPPAAVGERKAGQTLREIQALVAADKISAARAVAEEFLKTTPTGPEADEIMGLTGVHPRP